MGQGSTGAAVVTVRMDGLSESLRVLSKAGAQLHGLETGAVLLANSMLRAAAGRLAQDVARTTVKPLLERGPAPQSEKLATTIRHKVDRIPTIKIGAVNPPLSGFRAGAAGNARWRTSLAWGVEKGPGPGQPNRYGIPRANQGHVIGPNLDRIQAAIVPEYEGLVRLALESAGVTAWDRL